jgi:flagellar biosynthetic protein FliR
VLEITDTQLLSWLAAWLWPFLRLGAFVLVAPVIGTRSVPAPVRVLFALGLTVVLTPLIDPASVPDVPIVSAVGLCIGLGLVLRMVFMVLEFAGQLIAQQMGLGFAAMVDPASGAQVPVIAQFYVILGTLMFFAFDAHLKLVELLVHSFELMPLGGGGFSPGALARVIDWSGELLGFGVIIMLPVVASLLVVNLAFGVMARAAPQLNIFAVGFPIMILFGSVMIVLTLAMLPEQVESLFSSAFGVAYEMMRIR